MRDQPTDGQAVLAGCLLVLLLFFLAVGFVVILWGALR
jgi:hypothetical protein